MNDNPRPVLLDLTDGVATVTLNRPEAMNALDVATKEALLSTLREVAEDPAARVVVLTGAGDRAFCVGQDLKEHIGLLEDGTAWDTVPQHYNPIVTALAEMPKPVVARINGACAGAGAAFAMACDVRVMAAEAQVTFAFAGIGLSCDSGTSWHLPRLVGPQRAAELLLMGGRVSAQEALAMGLVGTVVPAAELDATVAELAGRLAQGPTVAYAAIKASLRTAQGTDLPGALAFEAEQMRRTGSSRDHRAAVEAFLAKERPVFAGE
ncbi:MULTISPECIES: enoyl-CoA hydratase/isomerase family protein [Kytococcus]|uniref:Enoyl-CoA hydratase n=1 Tax=Kytococcus schroeteri TaxID=138300 RepID=A0A2I1PDA6_9MICO|nr:MULTISPECIES: enoyl-CoA hydratase-related protein [Kytococcus]OFS13966.1 enoyl-CoA hydratase [Kytococcus sp. HMSC28H12]PKZ42623.1 enoyl-CoA hydratase [Kytococcus schroeteri]